MKLKSQTMELMAIDGVLRIGRNEYGIPEIDAQSGGDMQYGLGWLHACDRQMQSLLTRVLLRGRAAECLAGEEAMIELDRFFRSMNFLPDPQAEIAKLQPQVRDELEAYCAGFNRGLMENGVVWEMRMLGYEPEPWDITDCLLIGKAFGFVGLSDAQLGAQRLLVQMIQNGIDDERIRELFPYLTEEIDRELIAQVKLTPPMVPEAVKWLSKLPKFQASNNWAVSGERTKNGNAFLCGDPHLEVNRLPAVWQEFVARLPDNEIIGACVPGLPGPILGRTRHIAWSATYSFMDMLDWRIEKCRDGMYWREDGWQPFDVREEAILVKKSRPFTMRIYENENGVIEGDPLEEGLLLAVNWSARHNCGAGEFNGLLNLRHCRTAAEAMECFKLLDAATFNFVIADSSGNIGYQMSGRTWQRAPGVSGLMPLPGWEDQWRHAGFVDKDRLPASINPAEGYIVTANQDLNHLGDSAPINLPMAPYRAQRISEMLEEGGKMDAAYFQKMHMDLFSVQARRFMPLLRPLLPDTENGRLLAEWDLRYDADSLGAMLFESVYLALMRVVFGDDGLGRGVIDHVFTETGCFNDYYGNFDNVLMNEAAAWFGQKGRDDALRRAIDEGLAVKAARYGSTRKVLLANLLLGGKMPSWLGFDYGPIELPGGRATIPQGQIFKSAGRITTFSPSLRMIADMGSSQMYMALAGGPTDRRFSRWYISGLADWLAGRYKLLGGPPKAQA